MADTHMTDTGSDGTSPVDITPADQFHAVLDAFLADNTTRAEDKATLLKYLTDRPPFSKPTNLTPIHEVEDRLEIAREIEQKVQKHYAHWSLSTIDLSIMNGHAPRQTSSNAGICPAFYERRG